MPSEIQQWFAKLRKEESEWGYRYVMKGYSYFECMNCKKPIRMLSAGVSQEALDNMECPCGSKKFKAINKGEYDKLTSSKKILKKKDEAKFAPPKEKIKRKHLHTMPVRLGQTISVSPVTEKHGEAEPKREANMPKDKDKGKGKGGHDRPKRRRGRVLGVEESTGATFLDADRCRGRLEEIRDIETEYGDSLRWIFAAVDEEDEPLLSGITSRRMTERSKAFKWSSSLLGETLEVGDEVDLDDLIGLEGELVLKQGSLKDGTEVSNVDDVLPLKKKKEKEKGKEKGKEKVKGKQKARREEEEGEEEEEEEEGEEEGEGGGEEEEED